MKTLEGIVVSANMIDTAIVEIVRYQPHPMYRKLQKKSKKYKVDTREVKAHVGDTVAIQQTRPLSKDKHFKITKVVKKMEELK